MAETAASEGWFNRVASRPGPAIAFYLFLTLLFYLPLCLGRSFIAADFLFRTPPWYDPNIPLHNFDLFDVILIFYPHDNFLNESLRQGFLPLWNPYNFAGHPIMADGYSGFLYPPRLLLQGLFPTVTAQGMLLVGHTFLAGISTWFLGRRLGQSGPAALLTGTAWMFSGTVLVWLEEQSGVICCAWLPIILLALDNARSQTRGVALGACCVGMLTVSGSLQFVLYVLMSSVAFSVYRIVRARQGLAACLRVGLAIGLGLLLAAAMLLPFLSGLQHSQRPIIPFSFLIDSYRKFLVGVPLTLLAPDAFGTAVQDFAVVRIPGGGTFTYSELCVYAGLAPLLLALIGFFQKGPARFFAVLAAVSLILPATPLYAMVCLLPGFKQLIATRIVFVWGFCAAMLSGFGLDALQERWTRQLALASSVVACLLIAGVQVLHRADAASLLNWLFRNRLIRLPDRELFPSDANYLQAVWEGFHSLYAWTSPAVWMPILWLIALSACLLVRRARPQLLILLVASDLMSFGLRFNTIVPSQWVYPETATTRFLEAHAGLDRVMGLGTFKPDSLMPYHQYDVAGYETIYPRPAAQYLSTLMWGKFDDQRMLPSQIFPIYTYRSPLVDLMGVRYIVAYPDAELQGMKLVAQTPLRIYENPNRLPRAFLLFSRQTVPEVKAALALLVEGQVDPRRTLLLDADPGGPQETPGTGSARIESYSPHAVTVRTEADRNAWLVLTDSFDPGWKASIDGQETSIYKADVMFRAVRLPGGSHQVRFSYQPIEWTIGLWVSGCTALLLIGLYFFSGRTGRGTLEDQDVGRSAIPTT